MVQRPAQLDGELAKELASLSTQDDPFETHLGRTMCTYDFYEGMSLKMMKTRNKLDGLAK